MGCVLIVMGLHPNMVPCTRGPNNTRTLTQADINFSYSLSDGPSPVKSDYGMQVLPGLAMDLRELYLYVSVVVSRFCNYVRDYPRSIMR